MEWKRKRLDVSINFQLTKFDFQRLKSGSAFKVYSFVLLILEAITVNLDVSSGKQKLCDVVDTK